MKFFQVVSFYPQYLADFYGARPELVAAPFQQQIDALLRDGFSAAHVFAPYLERRGHETMLVVANSVPAQSRWALENGLPMPRTQQDLTQILARQVEAFRPDVWYSVDPIQYDSRFIRSLAKRPPLVVGWRAASIPPGVDWTEYDLIIGSDEGILKQALEKGARTTESFHPGFPSFLAHAVADEPKRWDVLFAGQISPEHTRRLDHLSEVARAPLGFRGEFDIGYFLHCQQPHALPSGLQMHNMGAVWGERMHRTLKSGRINLNVHIDFAVSKSQNMRIFETLGTGSFLLTEADEALGMAFEPGSEVETYRDKGEMIDKIYYYLEHAEEREAIAKRGQARCLRDHAMERRAEALDHLLNRHLRQAGSQAAEAFPANVDIDALLATATTLYRTRRIDDAHRCVRRMLAAQPSHLPALNLLALILHAGGDLTGAIRTVRQVIRLVPERPELRYNLGRLSLAANDVDTASKSFAAIVALTPGSAEAYLALADSLGAGGRLDQAAKVCGFIVSLNPTAVEGRMLLGQILLAQEHDEEASAQFRKVLETVPDHAEARAHLSRCRVSSTPLDISRNPTPDRVILVTGLPPGPTGTGVLVAQLLDGMQRHGVSVDLFQAHILGDDLVAAVLSAQEETCAPVLLMHPQSVGTSRSIELMERVRTPLFLYLLDNSYFCIRSYNHVPGQSVPCIACMGGTLDSIDRFGCTPHPVDDPWGAHYIHALMPLVRSGKVRLLAQNRLQVALALRHFGADIQVPVIGLWTEEMERMKDLFQSSIAPSPSNGLKKRWSVAFHAQGLPAKGVLWALDLARRCPDERFLFPFHVAEEHRSNYPNCDFLHMTWDSGLQEAIEDSRIVLVPSLWSAPIESALVKSVIFASAVAVADNASTYAAELPEGLVLRLPVRTDEAAPLLRQRLAEGWKPDEAVRRQWLGEFRAANITMVPKLLSLFGASAV